MASFQLTEEYNSLGGVGGTCYFCNASKRTLDRAERIVTTDMVGDMVDAPPGVWPERWVEACEQCINEMGHLVGMISEGEVQGLVERLNQLEEFIGELKAENARTQKDLDDVSAALAYVRRQEPGLVAEAPKAKR